MPEPAQTLAPPPLLVDAKEAARLLGLSRATFYSLHASGQLGPMSVSFGRRKLFRAAELAAWVAHDPPCPPREVWMKRDRP
jgi:excisionase family DNA binding protein